MGEVETMAGMQDLSEQWQQAYLQQNFDAAVGRLFKGLIHNLNGVIQVFSLQADLFGMMIGKGNDLVERLAASQGQEEARQLAVQLKELMNKRIEAVGQMQEKVRASQEILKRTLILPDFKQIPYGERYTLNTVIRTEVEFLCADSFFKHKVTKNLNLAEDMPQLVDNHLDCHQIIHFLLENALDALRDRAGAAVSVETFLQDGHSVVAVRDSGGGIAADVLEKIYEPFYTTKPDHLGVGLYLARKLVEQCGGSIACEIEPGTTRFMIKIPCEGAQIT